MNIPFGNMQNFMVQYQNFCAQMQKNNSDPSTMIQNLMNNGRVSQSAYNNARILANQIQSMIPH